MLAEKNNNNGTADSSGRFVSFEMLSLPVMVIDARGSIIFINECACETTGYLRSDMLGKTLFDIAPAGDLKRKTSKVLREEIINCNFSSRGYLVTNNGRIRKVDWHCRTIFNPPAILLSFSDRTEADMIKRATAIAAESLALDDMAISFMDLLSEPFNLKIARITLETAGGYSRSFSRTYPHGCLRKKTARMLESSRSSSQQQTDVRQFRLGTDYRNHGSLEVTTYTGSLLSADDERCILALCDIISTGITRLMPGKHASPPPSLDHKAATATAMIDLNTSKILDVTIRFLELAGNAASPGETIGKALPDRCFLEAVKACVTGYMPQMGICFEGRLIYCCMPLPGSCNAIITLMENSSPPEQVLNHGADSAVEKVNKIMSMMPHGFAIFDKTGRLVTANDALVKILGKEGKSIEGLSLEEIVQKLSLRRKSGSRLGLRQLATYRAIRHGKPVTDMETSIQVDGFRRILSVSAYPLRDDVGNITGGTASIRDVTVTNAIFQMGRLAGCACNADELIEETLDIIMNAARLQMAWLYLGDEHELRLKIQKGSLPNTPVPVCREEPDLQNPGIAGRTFLKGKPVMIKDYRRCHSVRLFDPLARKRSIGSIAGIPLCSDRGTIGVLVVATGDDARLDESRLSEIVTMCKQLTTCIDRATSGAMVFYSGA